MHGKPTERQAHSVNVRSAQRADGTPGTLRECAHCTASRQNARHTPSVCTVHGEPTERETHSVSVRNARRADGTPGTLRECAQGMALDVLAFRTAPPAFGAGFSHCTANFEQGGLLELHGNYRPAPF